MGSLKVKQFGLLLVMFMLMLTGITHAAGNEKPLPPNEAFVLSVTVKEANLINVHWQIAPGYYLYRQRLHFNFDPKVIADIRLPQPAIKPNMDKEHSEIYAGEINIPITMHTQVSQLTLGIDYQGCSAGGFCYPPAHQTIKLNMTDKSAGQESGDVVAANFTSASFQSLLQDQQGVRHLLDTQRLGVMLLIFAGLGLLLAFTPCVLPMIPILTSIIVGHKQPVSTRKAFFLSLAYVIGSAITYAGAGVLAAWMGRSLQTWLQQSWIMLIVAAIFALLALSLFGLYDLRLPRALQNRITALSRKQEGGTYVGVFVMGVISTLIVSPCVTAPLVGVLMYIAESGNIVLGASALFAMGLGMGIPLIAIGVTTGKWLPKRGPWMNAVQKVFGVLMLVMAVMMLARTSYFSGLVPTTQAAPEGQTFTVVHSVEDVNKQLALAKSYGKPVILDFYADWCESCVSMDTKVFSSSEVKKMLSSFVLLRADLSANNANDEAMLQKYDVIAPPTVVFFNTQGGEVNSHRIVGELNAQEFMARLSTFFTASCDKKVAC